MINNSYFKIIVVGIFVFFILFANIFQGIGSKTMLFLGFLGIVLFFFTKKRPSFSKEEKWLFGIFIGYLGAYLLSAAVNTTTGVLEEIRGKHFEKEAYLLFFLPISFRA